MNKVISLRQKVILILLGLLVATLSIFVFEVILRIQQGSPLPEQEPPQFYYQYVEIYEKFFKKIRRPDGKVVYKVQRSTDNHDEYLENLYFPANKGKNIQRIFIVGGSVATTIGRSDYLKKLLEDLLPDMKFEVICCGRGCYDSYREALVVNEILKLRPDLIIILSGNNELLPISKLNPLIYRLNRFFQRSWLFQIVQEKYFAWSKKTYSYIQISYKERLADFEKNLRTIIQRAKRKNVPVILSTLPANFHDYAPRGIPPRQDRQFFLAWVSLEKGEFGRAVEEFQEFLSIHPEDPFGHYFLAQCFESLGDYLQAQNHYLKALHLDSLRGHRFLSPLHRREVIYRLCSKEDIVLADLEETFIKISPNGLVGVNVLVDGVHWWNEYNSLIEKVIVESIIKYNITHAKPIFAPLNQWKLDRCKEKINFEKINIFQLKDSYVRALRVVANSLFFILESNQKDYVTEDIISSLKAAHYLNPHVFDDKIYLKEYLFKSFSRVLGTQSLSFKLDKIQPILLMHIGETFRRLGLYSKAIENFNEALHQCSDLCYAYIGRGLAQYEMGLVKEANKDFEKASKLSPQHPLIGYYREFFKF